MKCGWRNLCLPRRSSTNSTRRDGFSTSRPKAWTFRATCFCSMEIRGPSTCTRMCIHQPFLRLAPNITDYHKLTSWVHGISTFWIWTKYQWPPKSLHFFGPSTQQSIFQKWAETGAAPEPKRETRGLTWSWTVLRAAFLLRLAEPVPCFLPSLPPEGGAP